MTSATDHDPFCYLNVTDCDHGNTRVCHCALIARVVKREREERERDWAEAYARVDAEARADERIKVGTEANAVVRAKDERIADLLEELDEVRERLRAEAMNLPSRVELDEVGNEVTWVQYADVCELLGGESDD